MTNPTQTPLRERFADILKSDNFIDGEWLSEGKGEFFEVKDKYSQELIAKVPMATSAQVESAIASSERAFKEIGKWSAEKRRAYLEKTLQLFREREEQFAQLIAAEAGKPISYARGEVARCAMTLQLAVDHILSFTGETVNIDYGAGTGRTAFTKRFPIGPVSCISPFNFPLNLALHKVAPALAVGCPVVLKPSPFAPLSAMAFAGLCEEAGYPAGAVNVFLADIPEADPMVTDDRLKLLTFTGSPQVGWYLKSRAGKKRVILELGGNAAVIVDETADLAATAKKVALGSFLYAGQICISTQRIYVQREVFEEFTRLLALETEALPTGDPRDETVLVGPLIDKVHLDRIAKWVKEAVSGGAKLLSGGKILSEKNFLYAPTLLTNTNKSMKVVCEEAFGPVAVVEAVDSFEEALALVNDSSFGLQAGVFTSKIDRMKACLEELEVGGIIINNIPGFRVDGMPYGGVKDSGLGREGIKYAMEDMTEPRLLVF
jgi:glyceraldehyde-3-phosphate dehydrogenase (NADP+)